MRLLRSPLLSACMMAIILVALILPAMAAGTYRREVVQLTILDGDTASDTAAFSTNGIIRLARGQSDVTTTTLTLSAWCGPDIGAISLASDTLATTGTETLDSLAIPVVGETRVQATASSAVDGDTEVTLILLIEE